MRQMIKVVVSIISLCLMVGCSLLNPVPQKPDVKLVGLRMLPATSLLERHIAVDLSIMNPNKKDLSIRSINYTVGLEGINLLSGATDQVPVLKAMQETPVTLEVSADMLQILRLVEHFAQDGISDKVNYNFSAVIDFTAWLPSMHVDRKGALPLGGTN